MSSENHLVFAWWNTSLAPSGNSRSTPEERALACQVILNLITSVGADFIALGEMSDLDLEDVASVCNPYDYTVHSGVTKAGRSQFDICFVINERKLSLLHSKDIVSKKGESTLKIAKRLDVASVDDGTIFHLLISHWPSRLWCEENHADRHTYGLRLRDSVEDIFELYESSPFVIMLGDYNDEPFDKSLSDQVMASRDIDLVRRKRHLLYNPFWQHLCKRTVEHSGSGSYYYKGGKVTKWHTFDQLIYSHAFVTSSSWSYKADENLVHEIPQLVELVTNPAIIFDHLPVYGKVERSTQHG
ncbi:endonuclease/exonuclease/phosphatase family protein [Pseudomonas sp. LAIL14HWK12:I7]|uniref:endonuclease/exonuclease/phosphatase family protein n=1 Tax=Pseudomonas sp. LAIL14HWK12:I7 TaxID=1259801 RepID=UPI0004832D2F|nr:endonuclease/exonuclease/phosphatase family protein [Pseudomonas sp. LAIL14HWK12:I7]